MKIIFITPTTALRRFLPYRWGGKIYGQSNSITGPLILGGILKKAGHEVEVCFPPGAAPSGARSVRHPGCLHPIAREVWTMSLRKSACTRKWVSSI